MEHYLITERIIIYACNHHVRLRPPELMVVRQPQLTRDEGADTALKSSGSRYPSYRLSD
jgi:hypothetical protein